jgi:lipoprotein-anchoring transpeptidase ErfK/SrfK
MPIRIAKTMLIALVALALVPLPAFAVGADRGPIVNNAIVNGVHLKGMSEAEARAAIAAVVRVPDLPTQWILAGGKSYPVEPEKLLVVDVNKMVARAYAPTLARAVVIRPRYRVGTAALNNWVDGFAATVNRKPQNAAWAVKKEDLVIVAHVDGRTLRKPALRRGLVHAVVVNLGTRKAQPAVVASFSVTPAAVTAANIGKAIIVDESKRTLRLYNRAKVEKAYRCAVGQPRYPTPKGRFKVINKVKNPAWHNPGSSWALNMPAYIAPGPSNPLGTRALYLDAPGIRIHGTNKLSSIGTAASHGCVRMANRDVENLYPRVPIGTPVFIIK